MNRGDHYLLLWHKKWWSTLFNSRVHNIAEQSCHPATLQGLQSTITQRHRVRLIPLHIILKYKDNPLLLRLMNSPYYIALPGSCRPIPAEEHQVPSFRYLWSPSFRQHRHSHWRGPLLLAWRLQVVSVVRLIPLHMVLKDRRQSILTEVDGQPVLRVTYTIPIATPDSCRPIPAQCQVPSFRYLWPPSFQQHRHIVEEGSCC